MKYLNNIPEYNVTQFNRAIKEVIESNFDYVRKSIAIIIKSIFLYPFINREENLFKEI